MAHVKRVTELNNVMRKKLYDGLVRLGLKPAQTQANFVYFETPNADSLYQWLLKKGIIVRPMGPKGLRVTTGTEEETGNFLKIFEEVLMSSEVETK